MQRRLCRRCGEDISAGLNGKRLYCSDYCVGAAYREKRQASRQPAPRSREEALADLAGGAVGLLEALCRAVAEGAGTEELRDVAAHARQQAAGLVERAERLMPGVSGREGKAC